MRGPIDRQKLVEPKPLRRHADASQKNRCRDNRRNGPWGRRKTKGRRMAAHAMTLLRARISRASSPFLTDANSSPTPGII
jgi:hypothetical protein